MEYLDIVDENGLPTGQTAERSEIHAKGLCHRTAHIWIARKTPGAIDIPAADSGEEPVFPSDSTSERSELPRHAFPSRCQVLLQKRAMTKDSFPGCYDTSSAGHIQAGDEPLDSALRELSEELGIEASPEDLTFMGNARIRYEKEFHGKMFRDNEVVFLYLYAKDVDIDALRLQAEELDSVRWFDVKEVAAACAAHDPAFCVPPCGIDMVQRNLYRLTAFRR